MIHALVTCGPITWLARRAQIGAQCQTDTVNNPLVLRADPRVFSYMSNVGVFAKRTILSGADLKSWGGEVMVPLLCIEL